MSNTAYILLGGNMGDREHYLSLAREHIEKRCGKIHLRSSIYQTAAWGLQEQAAFLNQVVAIETALDAESLLTELLSIEKTIGRKRDARYGPRTIDLDILLFDEDVINTPSLTIPHPELQNRRFVLVPLAEVARFYLHPVLMKTVQQLLAECPDQLAVQKFH